MKGRPLGRPPNQDNNAGKWLRDTGRVASQRLRLRGNAHTQRVGQTEPAPRAESVDLVDLDAPLRRELDALYSDPSLDQHLQEAFDAAYAIGVRHPVG